MLTKSINTLSEATHKDIIIELITLRDKLWDLPWGIYSYVTGVSLCFMQQNCSYSSWRYRTDTEKCSFLLHNTRSVVSMVLY